MRGKEDVLASTEAFRMFQMLDVAEREKIPADFVDKLLDSADLSLVPPFKNKDEVDNYEFSKKAWYLIMYMCTFD